MLKINQFPSIPILKKWSLLVVAFSLYAISFRLPVLIYKNQIYMTGTQAFLNSFAVLRSFPWGIFYIAIYTFSNPLLYVSWLLLLTKSKRSTYAATLCVISMLLSGALIDKEPKGDLFHFPFGTLGLGYYLWLSSGVITLVVSRMGLSLRPNPSLNSDPAASG